MSVGRQCLRFRIILQIKQKREFIILNGTVFPSLLQLYRIEAIVRSPSEVKPTKKKNHNRMKYLRQNSDSVQASREPKNTSPTNKTNAPSNVGHIPAAFSNELDGGKNEYKKKKTNK